MSIFCSFAMDLCQVGGITPIPPLMKENYLRETELLCKLLPASSSVLQVGSMDGERAIRLLRGRPDLQITGLEIEQELVNVAKQKVPSAGFKMKSVLGNITALPDIGIFDYVICLNNTLGYISPQEEALDGMRRLSKNIIVSVYGEKFTNGFAKEYFDALGLEIAEIDGDKFVVKDFTSVRRYNRGDVEAWSEDITETPVGYFCILK